MYMITTPESLSHTNNVPLHNHRSTLSMYLLVLESEMRGDEILVVDIPTPNPMSMSIARPIESTQLVPQTHITVPPHKYSRRE